MILNELDYDDRSLVDIGCNAGVLTRQAARHGLFSVGIDGNREAISFARKKTEAEERLSFMLWKMTPDDLGKIPEFDVVLLLSVYHQWVALYGNDEAGLMLRNVSGKCRRKLFFEPASIQRKYGVYKQNFVDGDERSVVEFNVQMISDVTGLKVRFLGRSEAPDADERFRSLFIAERSDSER